MEIKQSKSVAFGIVCALGCETLFGLSYLFTKSATCEASAFALLGWRFVVAFAVIALLAAVGVVKVSLRGKPVKPLVLVTVSSPILYFVGETLGIAKTTASESGAFLAAIPVACLVASSIILNKKPTIRQISGILTTLCGVCITVFAASVSASFSVSGYFWLVVCIAGYSLYSVFVDKSSTYYSGAEIAYAMLGVGAIVFGITAIAEALEKADIKTLVTLPLTNKAFLSSVLYQAIGCSIAGFIMSNVAIAKIGVNRVASFIGVATVVAIVCAVAILKESFTMWQMLGAFVIVAGVYIANMKLRS